MKLYQSYDLVLYFYIYSFIGWCVETVIFYITDGKLRNRGLLNQPLILLYGFAMILLILGSGVSQAHVVFQFIMNIFRVILISQFCRFCRDRLVGISLFHPWRGRGRKERRKELREEGIHLSTYVLIATATFTAFKILHPFVYLGVGLIPPLIVKWIGIVMGIMLVLDAIFVAISARQDSKQRKTNRIQVQMRVQKMTTGVRLAAMFHRRLENAYPDLHKYLEEYGGVEETDDLAERKGIIFAKGICLDKLIWVFLISSLLGDLIETIYVRIAGGTWMRRSGVVFGPFSIVWGIGAVLLTIALYRLAEKHKLQIFVGGFFLGGTYEYMASVVLEVVFHTKFWDYSNIPLNINGRTNVWYMIGWGVLSMFWICVCYPIMSYYIEMIPPIFGKIVTWFLMICLCLDLAMTAAVMVRYNTRKAQPKSENRIELYLDQYYPDATVENMWPNLVSSM